MLWGKVSPCDLDTLSLAVSKADSIAEHRHETLISTMPTAMTDVINSNPNLW